MTKDHVDQYWEEGYTIIRNVFAPHEIEQLSAACDRWKFTGQLLGHTWRKKNTVNTLKKWAVIRTGRCPLATASQCAINIQNPGTSIHKPFRRNTFTKRGIAK